MRKSNPTCFGSTFALRCETPSASSCRDRRSAHEPRVGGSTRTVYATASPRGLSRGLYRNRPWTGEAATEPFCSAAASFFDASSSRDKTRTRGPRSRLGQRTGLSVQCAAAAVRLRAIPTRDAADSSPCYSSLRIQPAPGVYARCFRILAQTSIRLVPTGVGANASSCSRLRWSSVGSVMISGATSPEPQPALHGPRREWFAIAPGRQGRDRGASRTRRPA